VSTGKKTFVAAMLVLSITAAAMAAETPPPSASRFAALLVASTTAYASAHGDPQRIERPDCVEPVPGRYMCSYEVQHMRASLAALGQVPTGAPSCHLMQARWTPELSSLFTVTLAGRARSCRSLRDAIHSLR
jgi:hypothetical protein